MAKKRSKRKTTRKAGKKATRKTASRGARALGAMSTAELQRELRRREGQVERLYAKHAKLSAQLAEVEAEIAKVGGELGHGVTSRGTVRRRPRNSSNLAEALQQVLTGTDLSVTEAAEAVQAAGYRTSSANFRTIVNQTLIKDKRFKKVSRGRYTAK